MNLTLKLIFYTNVIAAIISTIGSFYYIGNFRKKKVKPLLYLGLCWLFISGFYYLDALYLVLSNIMIDRVSYALAFPMTIFLVLGVDYTRKERINTTIMSIISGVGFLQIYIILQPIHEWQEDFLYMAAIQDIFICIYLLDWGITSFIHAPKEIKRKTGWFLFSTILLGPYNVGLFILGIIDPFFIYLSNLGVIFGSIICIYTLNKEPKIFYILPFTAYRLNVVHIPSGHALFEFKWTDTKLEEDILSSCIHSLRNLGINILEMGEIKELKLQNGVLLFYESANFIAGLFATNSSKFLIRGLNQFSNEFEKRFSSELMKIPYDSSVFQAANEIVEKFLGNIPFRVKIN